MSLPLHEVWSRLIRSQTRNRLIARDIVALPNGRVPLVLSDRKEHLDLMMEEVANCTEQQIELVYLDGSLSARELHSRIEHFQATIKRGGRACLFSTASLIGEGFDLPELDTLFLGMPISFRGRIIQYAGRLHREYLGKSQVQIFDYLDGALPVAKSMFRKRCSGYREMGYSMVREDGLGGLFS